MDFGQRLRELREEKGLKQEEVASILDMKVRAYQLYEHGQGFPTFKRLIHLADHFNVSLDYLVGRSDVRERR